MGTTIASLRTTFLNSLLGRTEASAQPWSDTECNNALAFAIGKTWTTKPKLGILATGDIATAQVNEYSVPSAIGQTDGLALIARIDLLDSSGNYLDEVTSYRRIPGGKIVVKPRIVAGYTMRVTGYKPFNVDATDLPDLMYQPIAFLAASLLFGELAGKLANFQRQQGLDPARVVTEQGALAASSYWQGQYQSAIAGCPWTVSQAPRRAYR